MTNEKNNEKSASRGPLDRISDLEANIQTLMAICRQLQKTTVAQGENLDAVEELVGRDRVSDTKDLLLVQRSSAAVKTAIAEGQIAPAQVITEESIVVGSQAGADGKTMRPGQLTVRAGDFRPEVKEALMGKPVGSVYLNEADKSTFTVLEIYEPVAAPKPEEAPAEVKAPEAPAPEAAVEAPAQAEGAVDATATS